ncbi:MAG: site-specific DNA-methyltransferase [Planctomycetota bacterium]
MKQPAESLFPLGDVQSVRSLMDRWEIPIIVSITPDAAFPEAIENAMIVGDCMEVMHRVPEASLDLIYVDPPFCTGKSRKGESLPLGPGGRIRGEANGRTYIFTDAWEGGLAHYLEWLQPRLEEMARLLKPTGALMVHLDGNASHYVKVMLDQMLGQDRFINEIIWHYKSGGHPRKRLARKYDSILWYSRGKSYTYHPEAAALPRNRCRLCGEEQERCNHMKRQEDENGRPVIFIKSAGKVYQYYEDDPAPPCDVWLDIGHLHQRDPERTGYPTQKPLKLMKRLVALASNPGDVVADFFAGSGTTLIAAALLNRKWVGCDARADALDVAASRFAHHALRFNSLKGDERKAERR